MPSEEVEETPQHTQQNQTSSEPYPKWKIWKKRRYIVAILAFFGYFNVYTLRTNMSIAIVAMTEEKNVTLDNGTVVLDKEFDWDSKIQGYVLSSFFYGYITTVFFGGWISVKVGGKKVFAVAVGMPAIFTLLTPVSATVNVYLLITVRVLLGIFQGASYPCIQAVWAKWAPPLERSKLSTIGFSGSHAGTVVVMPASAYLATLLGWPSIFYFFGTVGIIWVLVWCYYVTESPAEDPRITKEELEYIQQSLGDVAVKPNIKVPFGKMLTSPPVWAIAVAHFVDNWGFYTLLTQLPMFMKDKFAYDLGKTGFLSCLPYLAMIFCMQFAGQTADYLRRNKILTTIQVRKLFTSAGFLINAIFMVAAVHVSTTEATVACLVVAVGSGVCAWSGFGVNYLEVAPKFASVIMGFGNTLATVGGVCSPILTGHIVTTGSPDEWRIIFYISAVFKVIGTVVYALLGTAEVQPWATAEDS